MCNDSHFFQILRPGLAACAFFGLEQPFPLHFHSHYLAGCLLAGKRALRLEHKTVSLAPGNVLLLNPGEPHGCASAGKGPMRWLGLQISPEYMFSLTGGKALIFSTPLLEDNELQNLFTHLGAGLQNLRTKALTSAASNILSLLIPRLVPQCPRTGAFEQLQKHLQNNIACSKTSLARFGEITHLGKYELVRQFGAKCGITPWRYLESERVNRGCAMLLAGEKIADVAAACGFCDQSHFARSFKARIGLTPGQFKKAAMRQEGPAVL